MCGEVNTETCYSSCLPFLSTYNQVQWVEDILFPQLIIAISIPESCTSLSCKYDEIHLPFIFFPLTVIIFHIPHHLRAICNAFISIWSGCYIQPFFYFFHKKCNNAFEGAISITIRNKCPSNFYYRGQANLWLNLYGKIFS